MGGRLAVWEGREWRFSCVCVFFFLCGGQPVNNAYLLIFQRVVTPAATRTSVKRKHIQNCPCWRLYQVVCYCGLTFVCLVTPFRRDRNELKITSSIVKGLSVILFLPVSCYYITCLYCHLLVRCQDNQMSLVYISLSVLGGVGGYNSNQSHK